MKIPTLAGTVKRRILLNYRADPANIQRLLPGGFRPKLYRGKAVAGICLIRLEHIRPKLAPEFIGLSSENAAHRIAVEWDEDGKTREGVFIPRRDTDSAISALAGGTLFPGEQNRAMFDVRDRDGTIEFSMTSVDGSVHIELNGSHADDLPMESIFEDLEASSEFFRGGALGYSVKSDPDRLDGITLRTNEWNVSPLNIGRVSSTFYDDESLFPKGTIEFDHALIMENVEHEWHAAPDFCVGSQ